MPGIKNNGLCNYDIDKEYNALDALRSVLDYIEKSKLKEELNDKGKDLVKLADKVQRQQQGTMNFDDNDLFVTNSPYKAASHAMLHSYGSKLLSTTVEIVKMTFPFFDKEEKRFLRKIIIEFYI